MTSSTSPVKMKVFAFALLLLVAVTYGEALQCINCVREAPDTGDCVETVETCPPEMDTCAKITYPAPHENTFHKSCFKMVECLKLAITQGLKVNCCNWDSCNK
uniref:UPAR/Ly6 domain-containing protein n=1 Tax=Lates calcarifer TaxID=8187 RepID=A0A4W6D0K0_LATCA